MATGIQVIEEGFRNYVIKVDADGTESAVTIVDVTTLNPPCTDLRFLQATYNIDPADSAELLWEATANVPITYLYGSNDADVCFRPTAGIPNNAGAGKTGNVLLTSTATKPYTLYLHFLKSGAYTN